EIWNRHKDGEAYPQWLTITAIKDAREKTTHYLGMFHDISELKQDQARMEHRAFHDPLTALPNRLLLTDRLRMALARALRHGRLLAVMFCDLDDFKQVNDTLGHARGDLLLQEVARRLGSILREEDTVGRQGGDEFVIILPDMADASYAEVAARRVLGAVAKPYELEGNPVRITISLGIAIHPRDGQDPDTLVQRADEAMYRAKQAGRDTYRLWRPEYARLARERQDRPAEGNGG
ncbi:MAG: sensor domain-containing diguanylate cyclase, partial [Desulfarculus sp.]